MNGGETITDTTLETRKKRADLDQDPPRSVQICTPITVNDSSESTWHTRTWPDQRRGKSVDHSPFSALQMQAQCKRIREGKRSLFLLHVV